MVGAKLTDPHSGVFERLQRFNCAMSVDTALMSLTVNNQTKFQIQQQPYLLTPWCRDLLEKLTGLHLVKKFPPVHRIRTFITALTSIRHMSLYRASPIQSIYPHHTSWISVLILSTHLCLGLPSGLVTSGFPTKTLYTPSPHPYAPHAQPISGDMYYYYYYYYYSIWISLVTGIFFPVLLLNQQ